MSELFSALGLVLVVEGLIWAAFPGTATRLLETASKMPEQTLRTIGLSVLAAGVILVWLVRG
jgi:uncharacterized protein